MSKIKNLTLFKKSIYCYNQNFILLIILKMNTTEFDTSVLGGGSPDKGKLKWPLLGKWDTSSGHTDVVSSDVNEILRSKVPSEQERGTTKYFKHWTKGYPLSNHIPINYMYSNTVWNLEEMGDWLYKDSNGTIRAWTPSDIMNYKMGKNTYSISNSNKPFSIPRINFNIPCAWSIEDRAPWEKSPVTIESRRCRVKPKDLDTKTIYYDSYSSWLSRKFKIVSYCEYGSWEIMLNVVFQDSSWEFSEKWKVNSNSVYSSTETMMVNVVRAYKKA